MLQTGDRVMYRETGDFGNIVKAGHYDNEWVVKWDDGSTDNAVESELTKVEVTVLEGPLTWDERGCVWKVGDKNLDHYLDNNGENYRITIETVVKEENGSAQ